MTRDQQLRAGENVPPAATIERVIETLARFHAAWWQHPLLGSGPLGIGRWYRDEAGWALYMGRRATAWANLIAAEGAWLPADLRRLYEDVLARVPGFWERYLVPRLRTFTGITVIHGDAYFANFLCPIDPVAGQTYLIDWQSPEAHLGAGDLVNMIATFWTPEQRHQNGREERMLRHYHTVLQASGVGDYTWDDLRLDYRLALIEWLLQPLQDRQDGAPQDYWWPKMQCLAGAYRDFDCAELLAR
jgi:hypothetical protein